MKKEALIILGILIIASAIFSVLAEQNITDSDNDSYNSTIDCNDNDSSVWRNIIVYIDNDSDEIGVAPATELCIGTNIPPGYSNVSDDCNDNESSIWQNLAVYSDNDNDSYGSANSSLMCLGESIPAGYSNVSGDCNESSAEINPGILDIPNNDIDENCDGFDNIDLDSDGFFRFNLNNHLKDCDDNNPFIYPNATELCNDIDDNCNGNDDENFPDKDEICYIGVGECRSSGEIICNQNGNATKCRAVANNPSKEVCDEKDNDCDGLTDEEDICNMSSVGIIIYNPEKEIYNTGKIPLNISIFGTGKAVDKISYIDYSEKRPREIILCRKCTEYGKNIAKILRLKDGVHNLLFKAYLNGSVLNDSKEIIIDSKKPKIYLPSIRTKIYTNGVFYFNYDENNVKKVTLFYENKSVISENCTSGKKKTCLIKANLSEYDGKDINYNFLIEDISGNIEKSKNLTAEVDTTLPLINELTYPVIGNYVYFRLNITEKNFKDISYYDNSDKNPKWRVLCSVLKGGICEKNQRLTSGEHNITIRVMDKAENSVSAQV